MRDVHKSTTYSTSPPPKKKKSSAKLDDTAKTMVENKTDTVEVVEDMEIEQKEEEIMAERSKNQDEKVLEKEKKNEEKELLYKKISEEKARKKKEEVDNQIANKKLEKRKIKQKSKNIKRKRSGTLKNTVEKRSKNIKDIPENCKKFVNENDVVYVVPGDGRCGQNSAAVFLFHDEKFGYGLKRKTNLFFAEHFYRKYQYKSQCSVDSPYKRTLKGTEVEFTDPEKLINFLKNDPNAINTWSDSEDLVVISDMYQMRIKIITTKGPTDSNPTVNWIHPDPSLKEFAELDVEIKDMTLLHEDDQHFNLVISGDSDIARLGSLSQRENASDIKEHIEDKNMSFQALKENYEKCLKRNLVIEKEYFECEQQLQKKTEELEKLRVELEDLKMIIKLTNTVKNKDESMDVDEENLQFENSEVLYAWKSSGFKRVNPQSESEINGLKDGKKELQKSIYFKCSKCEFNSKSETVLGKHMQTKHIEQAVYYHCKNCDTNVSNERELKEHLQKHKKETESSPECELRAPKNVDLEKHIQSKHTNELDDEDKEFNCSDCPFQGTAEEELRKHIDVKHTLKCRICNEPFQTKRNLMIHRKNKHASAVAPCKNFPVGTCNFTAESCFWLHGKVEDETLNIKCYICGNTYKSKKEVMKHRKQSHETSIEPCNKFIKRECPFQEEFCWFSHKANTNQETVEENTDKNGEKGADISFFQRVQKPIKPPIK